jgi:transcriptional regulator with XRE-family HTH domain
MAHSTHHDDYRLLISLLREVRKEMGVTQIELGQRLDNTQTFVSKVERGERRLDVVEFVEFCEAIGATPHEVLARFMAQRQEKATSGQKKAAAGKRARAS